jgi:hypothetical protein
MPANRQSNILFSVSMPREKIERLEQVMQEAFPATEKPVSRNLLLASICALITPEEAQSYLKRATEGGHVGKQTDAAKERKELRELVKSMSIEELKAFKAAWASREPKGD